MKKFESDGFTFTFEEGYASTPDYYYNDAILAYCIVCEGNRHCVESCILGSNTVALRIFKIAVLAYFEEGCDEDVFSYAVQYARMKKWKSLDAFLHDFRRFYQVE